MVNHSFLLGLLLIVLAGVWISFVLGAGTQNLQTQVIIGILTLLAAITVLNLNNMHKSHLLFTIYFIVGLLYSASMWIGREGTPILAVVALAAAIGFLSSVFGSKDMQTQKMDKSTDMTSEHHAMSMKPAMRTATKKKVARKRVVKKTTTAIRRSKTVSGRRVATKAASSRRVAKKRAPATRSKKPVRRSAPVKRRVAPKRRATAQRTTRRITRRRR